MPCRCRPYSRFLIFLVLILVILSILISLCIYYIVNVENETYEPKPMKFTNVSHCYKLADINETNSFRYLVDVLDGEKKPTPGKTIFFHETTCSKTGVIQLNAKQACAIESAARLNPNHDIFVLFASPVGLEENDSLPEFYDKLQNYNNIYWRNVNLWRYAADTKLFSWLTTNKLFDSSYLFEHMSDIVRALSLFRYGGYHVDLDVVVLKNFDHLGEDFVGDDWGTVVNGAVIHLNNYGVGREVLQHFFSEVINSFNGSSFIANGPTMLTRACEDICKTPDRTLWTREQCNGLMIQPKYVFYPISWSDFKLYFEPNDLKKVLELSKNSTVIHVWNDRSKTIWNKIGTNNAYQVIAEQQCPLVYKSSKYF